MASPLRLKIDSWVRAPDEASGRFVTWYVVTGGPEAAVLRRFSDFLGLKRALKLGRLPSRFHSCTQPPAIEKRMAGLQSFLDQVSPIPGARPHLCRFLSPTERDRNDGREVAPAINNPQLMSPSTASISSAGSAGIFSVAANDTASGSAAEVPAHQEKPYEIVFSNKTHTDNLALSLRETLMQSGLRVWQQQTSVPKNSSNWFESWCECYIRISLRCSPCAQCIPLAASI